MTTATDTTRPAHRGARGLIALFAVPWLLAPSVTGEGMQDPTLAAAPPVPVAPTAAAAPRPPTTEGAVVTYAALSDPAASPLRPERKAETAREASAEATLTRLAPPARAAATPATEGSFTFAVGDRLELRLFERYGGEGGVQAISTLVEFQEVSGDYVVQEDGTIFLPLLGAVGFAERTPAAVRADVVARYREAYGGTVEFTSRVLEREPVYVTGTVANPGVYGHVPGMTVLHALTLAGGLPGGDDALLWQRVDLSRERERLAHANLALARLYAESTVLAAESEGHPPAPPDGLAALVGGERAAELVADAAALRAIERARADAESEALTAVIAALEDERAVLREALTAAERAVEIRSGRVDFIEDVRKRGLTNFNNVNSVADGLISAEQHWNEVRLGLARVERELAQGRREQARARFDAQLERDRARNDLEAKIAEYEATRAATAGLLAQVRLPELQTAGAELEIVVVRRGQPAQGGIVADPDAPIAPGDVVRVRTPAPEAQSVGLF